MVQIDDWHPGFRVKVITYSSSLNVPEALGTTTLRLQGGQVLVSHANQSVEGQIGTQKHILVQLSDCHVGFSRQSFGYRFPVIPEGSSFSLARKWTLRGPDCGSKVQFLAVWTRKKMLDIQGANVNQTYNNDQAYLLTTMGVRKPGSRGSRKIQEELAEYKPRATKKGTTRGKKRQGEPSQEEKEAANLIEVESEEEETEKFPIRRSARQSTPTLSEIEREDCPESIGADLEIVFQDDEEAASQVLASMLLERQREEENLSATNANTHTPPRAHRHHSPGGAQEAPVGPVWSPLPPSSPPPESPDALRSVGGPRKRGWVSPGEWEEPGSPLPSSAYERMPWPWLFSRLFGPKGDSEPDADEQKALFLKE
ncbi:hypothetical protein FB451DRAFT_1381386 [Mycena latifolia]|nr:hypothetical protein FB451DRAFT_1381386 [Mycena latifolia]